MPPTKTLLRPLALALALLSAAGPAGAHHSFAMFNRDQPMPLVGTVKEFQWTNPHVWIQLMVTDAAGVAQEWSVECTSVNFLRRQGWDKDTLKPGDKVRLVVFPLKDGSHGGQFNKLTDLNGAQPNLQGYQ